MNTLGYIARKNARARLLGTGRRIAHPSQWAGPRPATTPRHRAEVAS